MAPKNHTGPDCPTQAVGSVQTQSNGVLHYILAVLDKALQVGPKVIWDCCKISATMSHNVCKYLPRRQLVFTDLRARLAEENILYVNVSMRCDSGGVVGNAF